VGDGTAGSVVLSTRVPESQLCEGREGVLAEPHLEVVPTGPSGSFAVSPLWTNVCRSAVLHWSFLAARLMSGVYPYPYPFICSQINVSCNSVKYNNLNKKVCCF